MKRKITATPTRVYSYGALPPTENAHLVDEQIRLAHRYRNKLVEIERARRARWEALVETVLPSEIAELFEERDAGVSGALAALKRAKGGKGRRADVDGEREILDIAKAQRAELWPTIKAARETLHGAADEAKAARPTLSADEKAALRAAGTKVPNVRAKVDIARLSPLATAIAKSDDDAHAAKLAAREASGLRHGNYIRVENAVAQASKDAPPRFTRYTGEGAVGTQLLGEKGGPKGLTVAEAFSGTDTRLRIAPVPADTFERTRHARRKASRTSVQVRVGSNPDRSPVWATFPIILHRPLPPDAVIKWAYVLRRKVGLRDRWDFQITIESAAFKTPEQPCGEGTVAVNFGWRNLVDGGIRVAYLVDDTGREEEVRVPSVTVRESHSNPKPRAPGVPANVRGARVAISLAASLQKCDDIRAIRDKNFDAARATLTAWLDGRDLGPAEPLPGLPTTNQSQPNGVIVGTEHLGTQSESAAASGGTAAGAPSRPILDRLAEARRYLHVWKAPGRLAGLLHAWEKERLDGDEEIVEALRAWAKQDRHLLAWEANQRDRRLGHRRDVYRNFAANLARRYAVILVGDEDFRDFTAAPAPEDGVPSDGKTQRKTARLAAPGDLREAVKKAAAKYGARVEKMDAAYATVIEAGTGLPLIGDPRSGIYLVSAATGKQVDQDANHCRNLLANASGPVTPKDGDVLAEDNGLDSQDESDAVPIAACADDGE